MSAITRVGTRASLRPSDGERGLLRALGEHRVGPEAAQLARDAKRQRARRTRARRAHAAATGRTRWKRVVARRAAAGAREHAHVELGRERVELLRERRRERQRVARAADHEQPLLHATARSELGLDRREDRFLRVARRPMPAAAAASRARSASSAKKRPIARRAPPGRRGGDEQAVLAVAHDLGHAADRRRDHRGADRERLDDRVREVLPGRREQRGVGGTEQAQHRSRGTLPEEADAPVEPELARRGARALRAPARRRRRRASRPDAPRAPRAPRRAPSAGRAGPAKTSSVPVELELARAARRAAAAPAASGAGFGSTETRAGSSPQRERDVAQVRARAEDVSRASQRAVPRQPQEARARRLRARAGTRRACPRSARCASRARTPRPRRA